MKKRGFTLVELLAVIVILGIITLIAIPAINRVVKSAREGTIKSSANIYMKALTDKVLALKMDGNPIKLGRLYDIAEIGVQVKNNPPSKGYVRINTNGGIDDMKLCINEKVVEYDGKHTVVTEDHCATLDTQIPNPNLLIGTNEFYEFTKNSERFSKGYSLHSSISPNSLINKTVAMSFYLDNQGPSEAIGTDGIANRFGCHLNIHWKNSTTGATTVTYSLVGMLSLTSNGNRVYMSAAMTPPSGYDTLTSLSVSFQLTKRPNSTNNNTWKIGEVKLEEGSLGTTWVPHITE